MQQASETAYEKRQLHNRTAQLMPDTDRRHYPRLAQSAEVSIRQLSPYGFTTTDLTSADVKNLSRGGICIGSSVPLVPSSVVQCQIGLPNLMFAIPTLMQVLWLVKMGPSKYSIGLRYLL